MNPHLIIQSPGGVQDSIYLSGKIKEANPHFESVTPYIQGQVIIRSNANATGAIIRGVPKETDGKAPIEYVKSHMAAGDLSFKESLYEKKPIGSIALGISMARLLRARPGDVVQIISPHFSEEKGIETKKLAKTKAFRIGGIFQLGMNEFDTNLVLMDLSEAQELFNLKDRVTGINVRLDSVDETFQLKQMLQAFLGPPFFIQSWQDLNRNFFSALKVEKSVMRILLTLIVTVAAFNIISTLIMVVMEKTKEIGVLRALGATRGGVQSIFLLEGFAIGGFGTLIGGVLGFYIAKHINGVAAIVERFTGFEVFPKDIYYFDQIPALIIPSDIFFIIFFALLMALLAALYPAHQAGKVSPVEAIRYE